MALIGMPGWKDTHYCPGVLIGNWYEDRLQDEKRYFRPTTTYSTDFKQYPGARPDVLVRRNTELNGSGLPKELIFGHGNPGDHDGHMITWYDQDYSGREREGKNKLPELRTFTTKNKSWEPEKSDHPIQGSPTNHGLKQAMQQQWETEVRSLARGMNLGTSTTYRSSYLQWPRNCYASTKRLTPHEPLTLRRTRSSVSLTVPNIASPAPEAATTCTIKPIAVAV